VIHKKPHRQITLRGPDPELSREIDQLAQQEGISTNKAALRLLKRGAGLSAGGAKGIGDSLDHLIGTWSKKEAADLLSSITACEQVDEEFWR
jgi:hypothetical protein